MLINEYLKVYEFSEFHEIIVSQQPDIIFPLIKTINFKKSKIINFLFAFRGLPKKMNTINGFIECGFIDLDQKKNEEMVLGALMGIGGIKIISPLEFKQFNETNHLKIVWNFKLAQRDNQTVLSTETRVHCSGKLVRLFFSIYWLLISYFSGVIRKEMLKLIKTEVELVIGKSKAI